MLSLIKGLTGKPVGPFLCPWMGGIPQGAMDGGADMYRMYGIPQGDREGDADMYRMYGIPQGARDGGADMYRMYGIPQGDRRAMRICPGMGDHVLQEPWMAVRHVGCTGRKMLLGNCSSVTAPALPYYRTSCTYALPYYVTSCNDAKSALQDIIERLNDAFFCISSG